MNACQWNLMGIKKRENLSSGAAAVVFAQQGKVVSIYGPINQDVTFDQIKADRMAVKAE